MRIAMIGSKGMPATVGGVERHVEELSARIASLGFDVTVYARPWYVGRAAGSVHVVRGVHVCILPSIATKHFDAITHTLSATIHAMRARMDVYHFHGVGPALCAFLPRLLRPGSRVIVTFHCVDRLHEKWGWFARTILTFGERAACAFAHETITVSESLRAYCMERYGRATTYIPNGVAPHPYVHPTVVAETLRAFDLSPRSYLLVVTRLVPHKRVHDVLAAYRALVNEHVEFRDIPLVVVGESAFTDAYAAHLRERAGGHPGIRFLGSVHGRALSVLYTNALAFIHASVEEGMPIALLEAGAAGAVPVISDILAHREVAARIGGVCFRTGDPHDLATALAVVLHARRSLARMGEGIREAVLRHYNWDRIAVDTARMYGGDRGWTGAIVGSTVFA